jgi:hypothetical protein
MLYADNGSVRPVNVFIVVKLHKCASTDTLGQPPRVHTNKPFPIFNAFTKGKNLETTC